MACHVIDVIRYFFAASTLSLPCSRGICPSFFPSTPPPSVAWWGTAHLCQNLTNYSLCFRYTRRWCCLPTVRPSFGTKNATNIQKDFKLLVSGKTFFDKIKKRLFSFAWLSPWRHYSHLPPVMGDWVAFQANQAELPTEILLWRNLIEDLVMLWHFFNWRLLNGLFNRMLGDVFLYRLHLYARTDMLLKGIWVNKSYLCSCPKA